MSKQTAVEWLHNQWANEKEWTWEKIESWFDQAKAMEREQIEDAFREGKRDGWQNHKLKTEDKDYQWTNSMEYYNSTYKGGEQ